MDVDSFITFDLFKIFDTEETLKSFLKEKIKDEKFCVVSIIGKTSLEYPDFKEHLIAESLNREIFQRHEKKREKEKG
ncbi:hypothetical protein CEXT_560021 [Caerostris extrusa]|uniref:Uncharacterized protein n=1 Tax=Caerostris extrusa TaxID=172846 RepID=A0AAV4RWX6_CAEEX|nr:hypothetical protein CEXT_560021 [Caerostris extrusa]